MSGLLQKRIIALVVLILTGLIFGVSISGCNFVQPEKTGIVIKEHVIPLAQINPIFSFQTFEIPVPEAPGHLVESNEQAFIDYSNNHNGYVTVGFLDSTDRALKVLVYGPNGREYVYNLTPGLSEVFPLTHGNGPYTVSVHEHVVGNIYKDILVVTVDVELNDEFVPFIHPNQYVNFCKDSPVTAIAAGLSRGANNFVDTIEAVYNYVVENISYDFELAETVTIGYKSDLNMVLEQGSGICIDMAALAAAMLRSQGIPSKLVFGYRYDPDIGNTYHAWVSVFSEEDGKVGEHISLTGGTWNLLDPSSETIIGTGMSGITVGDGKIYNSMFYY